jgi:hypothetical protein
VSDTNNTSSGWTSSVGTPTPGAEPESIAWVKIELSGLDTGQSRIHVWASQSGALKDLHSRDAVVRRAAHQRLAEIVYREVVEAFGHIAG